MTEQQRKKLAGVVWGLGVAIPAMMVSGSMGGMHSIPLIVFLAIAAIGGAWGVWLHTQRRPVASIILGALGGMGTLFAIPLYLSWRSTVSDRFFTLELLLPAAVVVLPLFAVWQFLDREPA